MNQNKIIILRDLMAIFESFYAIFFVDLELICKIKEDICDLTNNLCIALLRSLKQSSNMLENVRLIYLLCVELIAS